MAKLELGLFGYSTEGLGTDSHTLLPDPPRAERTYTVISADDHVVEPPNAFEDRLPKKLQSRAPKVVEVKGGGEAWLFDDSLLPNIAFAAASGRPVQEWGSDPERFECVRPGAMYSKERLKDMDLDGVYASLSFPSFLCGFGGGRVQTVTKDLELALATVRAYNDWHLQEWCGADPARFIPCQIPWLHDPEVGAEEIRKNAAAGFKAVSFPERTDTHGFPSIFTEHWDPIMRACEETGTVICLHTGSAGALPDIGAGAPAQAASTVFGAYALIPTTAWLYSMIPVRFPNLKICMSEGGIGWTAALVDRLQHLERWNKNPVMYQPFYGAGITPVEVLKRNFYFCALDETWAWKTRAAIGVERILVEVDYPHPDSTWPDTQHSLRRQLVDIPDDEIQQITWRNASELFRHPVPTAIQKDPNAF